MRLEGERRKMQQPRSKKKVGNCHGGIYTLVISDFGTVMVDVVYQSFNLKSFWGGSCCKVSSSKISYGGKRQTAQSREERMNESS